jgi:hypothetical protein
MNQRALPGRPLAGRRRAGRRLLAALGAAVVPLGFLTAFAPSGSAATPTAYTLTSGAASFKAGGHTWKLQFSVLGGRPSGVVGADSLSFAITTSHLGGTEEHSWAARAFPAGTLTVAGNGDATFKSAAAMSKVATFSLTFKAKSHSKASCASGSGTNYTGTLSGKVTLKTGLKGLNVSKRLTFAKPNTLLLSHGCVPPTPCDLSGWSGINPAGTLVAGGANTGGPSKQAWFSTVEKADVKTAASDLRRSDGGFIASAAPKFSSTGKSLTVTASSAGLVTGKGIVNHTTVSKSPPLTCYWGRQKYSETESIYEGSFSASTAFEAHTLLTGTISVPKAGLGFFTIHSFKKK